ncbi:hypothetical protein D5R38_18710 [Serratia marcescens]|uniref:hypothetical protein n=1 Tax=Serratia marcescens TaxID=615 RepID=UPI0010685CD0|nr:hypothetical protein [Serratia marcescens]TEW83403.1 hypothetical protein D5R38_18710 [Serratia marcescens]
MNTLKIEVNIDDQHDVAKAINTLIAIEDNLNHSVYESEITEEDNDKICERDSLFRGKLNNDAMKEFVIECRIDMLTDLIPEFAKNGDEHAYKLMIEMKQLKRKLEKIRQR